MKFPAIIIPKSPDFYISSEAKCKIISVHGENKGKTIESKIDSSIFKHGYYSSVLKMIITNGNDEICSINDILPQEMEQYGIQELFVTALNFRTIQAKASDNKVYNLGSTFYNKYTNSCLNTMLNEIGKTMTATIKLYKKDEDIIHIEYGTSRSNNSSFKLVEGLVLNCMTEPEGLG